MESFLKKTTLILIGLAMIIGCTLLSPAMHEIALSYPEADPALLPLLITLPSLTLLAGLVISSASTGRVPAKAMILLGLVLILLGGVIPALLDNLFIIIVLRGVLGVGLGIIMPLQMALFAQYPERERAALIGLNSAVNCIIGVFFFTIAGRLAVSNWHHIFYLYSVFALILLLAIRYIPSTAIESASSNGGQRPNAKLPARLFLYCVFVALGMITFYVFITNMAAYLNEYSLGDAAMVGVITAVGTAGSAAGGFLVPQITRLLKNYAAPITLGFTALGFLFIIQTNSVAAVGLGYVLMCFSQGSFGCVITFKFTQIVALEQVSLATSCYMATIYLCQFAAPFLMIALQSLSGLAAMRAVFILYAAIMTCTTFIFLFVSYRENKQQPLQAQA